MVEDSFNEKGSCGFTFGNGCSGGVSEGSLFGRSRWAARSSSTCPSPARGRRGLSKENMMSLYRLLSALLSYPEQELLDALPRSTPRWPSTLGRRDAGT